MSPPVDVRLKRVYDEPDPADGFRALVDRLWPRGMTREAAALDLWARDVAPSTELRRAFAHKPDRFAAFAAAYRQELRGNADPVRELLEAACASGRPALTLLYAARDPEHNHARVLREHLRTV